MLLFTGSDRSRPNRIIQLDKSELLAIKQEREDLREAARERARERARRRRELKALEEAKEKDQEQSQSDQDEEVAGSSSGQPGHADAVGADADQNKTQSTDADEKPDASKLGTSAANGVDTTELAAEVANGSGDVVMEEEEEEKLQDDDTPHVVVSVSLSHACSLTAP